MTPSLAIDAEYGVTQTSASDDVATGRFATFGPTRYDGPTDLEIEARLHAWILAARGGMRIKERYSIEGVVGAIEFGVDGTTSDGTRVQSITHHETAVFLGIEASARPFDFWTAYARYGGDVTGDRTDVTIGEIGVRSRLTTHVGLFGGWRWWSYTDQGGGGSKLTIDARGPVVGLSFVF